MKKLRIGVLSTANIGTEKVIPAMQQGRLTEVTAISSRSADKARAAAAALGIDKIYGSYEELLADPDIDAVYNPLPNHLHCPWSKKAMQAGSAIFGSRADRGWVPPTLRDVETAEAENVAEQSG